MGEENGKPVARADIQMRVVLDVRSYADAGELMDEINTFMRRLLEDRPKARFDFIAFQTHPCKAMQMEQMAYAPPLAEVGPDDF